MLDAARPCRLQAVQIGRLAARALRSGPRGEVRGVLERGFYVVLGGQWLCVGPSGFGAGPLNVLCAPENIGDSPAGRMAVGEPVTVGRGAIRVGAALAIAFDQAPEWVPEPAQPWTAATLAAGISALREALPDVLPADGLAALLRPQRAAGFAPVAAAARQPAACLRELIRTDAAAFDPAALTPLVGLGPELTPSGDDFLGGALVALQLLGLTGVRDAIWAALAPVAPALTSDIGFAHLAAAAEGYGSGALHALLNDVIGGGTQVMTQRIEALAALGHTSGWDALAGAVTALRAAHDYRAASM